MAKKKQPLPLPQAPTNGWQVDNLYSDVRAGERMSDVTAAAEPQKAPSLSEMVKAAWDSESSLAALMQHIGAPQFKADKKYNPTSEAEWVRITKDIPPEYHSHLLDSTSAAHADYKRQKIMEEVERMQKLPGAAGLGVIAGVTLLDPGVWALSAATGGAFSLTKLSRMKRFLGGGSVAAGENMALEAYLAKAQETRDESDVAFAGLVGFGLGGTLSAMLKPAERSRLNQHVKDAIDKTDQKTLDDAGVLPPELKDEMLAEPTPARVLSVEEIKQKLDADAEAAKAEVLSDIKAKGEAGMPEPVAPVKTQRLSDVDRAKLQARVDREDQLWAQRKADEEAARVEADMEAQKIKNTEPFLEPEGTMADALRPLKEQMTRAAVQAEKKAESESVWDLFEKDALAAKERETELAFAQREQQLADNPELIPEGNPPVITKQGDDNANVTPEEPLVEAKVPEADDVKTVDVEEDTFGATPVAVGDDLVVELPDGRMVGGRVKSYNEDTGIAVILDDATDKPVRVNLNKVEVTSQVPSLGQKDEGFIPEGSVGSAQVLRIPMAAADEADEAIDVYPTKQPGKTAMTHLRIPGTNIKIPIRFDYYAKFLTSGNDKLKRMASMLLADPVGDVDHAGRGMNASELASMDWHRYKGRFFITANDAFDGYAKAKGWGTVDRLTKAEEFYTAVTRAVRDYSTNQYTDPHVAKVVMEIQKIHKEMLEQAQKYGVKGAEEILPDPFYMMRRFHHNRIIGLTKRFGDEQMIKLVKGAIRSVRPVTEEMAERIARNYFKVVRGLPYEDMQKLRMGDAGKARIRAIADDLDIDQDLIDEVFEMALAKPGKVEGDSGRLKSRTLLNENYSMKLKDSDGKEVDVSMEEFFENDARTLMDLYTRQMSGHIGLAKMGIRSDADFERMLKEVREEAMENFQDMDEIKGLIKHMKDVYSHILGRPMSDEVYGKAERVAKAVRDLNFIRMMGQVGFAQMAEIGNTLGYAGMRAMAAHMPALREVIKMAKGGHMDDQLARDLINMGGLGAEMASMHPMARSVDDVMFSPGLTKAERALAYGRHGVAMVSGLAPITNMLRQISSRAFVQKFSDYARGLDKMKKGDLDRLAHAGITAENRADVFRDIKRFTKVTGKTSKVETIDWEKWAKEAPDTYETFRLAVWRESRRVVQEQTIGETAPWMHTTIGKILTQFRGFMLVAHAKQTLYGLHHMDWTVARAFMASMLFAGASYVAQTSMNFAGSPEKLEERLALDEIAKAAFQRSSASSMIPATIDTLSSFAGWDTVFKYGRSSGLASGLILGNPSVDLLFNKMGGTASNVTQMFTTDDHMWTQKDVKNAVNIMVPNLIGVRTLIEAAAEDLPKTNPLREYNAQ